MEYRFAFLCDYAQQHAGKLHAIGIGWDTIYALAVPATHPSMGFVATLRGTIAEAGTKELTLRIIDADGADVIPPMQNQVPFEVKPPQLYGSLQVVIQLTGLVFQKYGSYAIHMLVQGEEKVNLPFNVSPIPSTSTG